MRYVILVWASLGILAAQSPDPAKPVIEPLKTTIVITATPVEPAIDRRNAEVFERTLFSRDDQVFHVLDAGINAGQHEGGGKSLEIRRFGFNLDHGGVSGGLKVLVNNVQQNQGTQGHGQGYLGSLKSLTPELVQEVNIINGPFSAEYGDFSGLGVVHIRTRQSMPDVWTVRMQGGSFSSERGFLSFSPELKNADAFIAYEGSHTDGPFLSSAGLPARQRHRELHAAAFAVTGASGSSSTAAGTISIRRARFRWMKSRPGGSTASATSIPPTAGACAAAPAGAYYSGNGLKLDGFASRSLFDLYSNFTFFLNDPDRGDGIQQHDSRLIEGANAQYVRAHKLFGAQWLLTAGGNFHDNQINVGLYPRAGRVPLGVTTRDHVRVTNGAGYVQESVSLLSGRIADGRRASPGRISIPCRGPRVGVAGHRAAESEPRVHAFVADPGHALRQLRPRHFHGRRARRGGLPGTAARFHHRLFPGGRVAAFRQSIHQRGRVLDRPLQRAGLHPGRWLVRIQGSQPRVRL